MKLVAIITADREVERTAGTVPFRVSRRYCAGDAWHPGLATAFPTTKPARAPPLPYDGGAGEGCQLDPRADDVRQDWPGRFGADLPA